MAYKTDSSEQESDRRERLKRAAEKVTHGIDSIANASGFPMPHGTTMNIIHGVYAKASTGLIAFRKMLRTDRAQEASQDATE